jgi:hypothetical protein
MRHAHLQASQVTMPTGGLIGHGQGLGRCGRTLVAPAKYLLVSAHVCAHAGCELYHSPPVDWSCRGLFIDNPTST